MTIFISEHAQEERYVTYLFLLYQYKSRRIDNILSPPIYNPTAIELCDDIINKKRITVSDVGLNNAFRNSGFTYEFSFTSDNKVCLMFDEHAIERLLLSEVKLMIRILQNDDWESSQKIREAYHEMAITSTSISGKLKFRSTSMGSRAVGLFLWDYCNIHGGLKKRGTQTAAIKLMDSQEWRSRLLALEIDYDDEDKLRNYIQATNSCVEAGEVLPFVGIT